MARGLASADKKTRKRFGVLYFISSYMEKILNHTIM